MGTEYLSIDLIPGLVKITLSGGLASYPRNAGDAKSLLSAADMPLYAGKSAGKNVVFFCGGFNK